MAMKRLLKNDPETGIRLEFHSDGETFTIVPVQVVDDITGPNQRTFTDYRPNARWTGDVHHVARLPLVVYNELKRQGILDDPKAFTKWLNDGDNRAFRTRPGRV